MGKIKLVDLSEEEMKTASVIECDGSEGTSIYIYSEYEDDTDELLYVFNGKDKLIQHSYNGKIMRKFRGRENANGRRSKVE